ncbi:MAG: L,D-transpeptidase family protein [Deltaproteobacteria bacterium]|nr:MAG: L,D-transpeptidase family protein [Deltaproteobacteria bacterium]
MRSTFWRWAAARGSPSRHARGRRSSAWTALAAAACVAAASASGRDAAAPDETLMPLVGEIRTALVEPDDTLLDVAYRNRLGFESVARMNPGVDPWIPEPGTIVRLPTRVVLPAVDPEGLVINVPEMRLYDFSVEPGPEILAAAVGDAEDPTPIGDFRIGKKRTDPFWNVPDSIRAEKPELPAVVPPGPENPLGGRWLTIGSSSYGIHGTNVRWSIGRMATHGCVRLYEDDVQRLFERIPTGTRVQIIYQPYLWGRSGDRIYFSAHPDLYGRHPDRLASALHVPRALGLLEAIDVERVWRAVEEVRGEPIEVGRIPDASIGRRGATSSPPS